MNPHVLFVLHALTPLHVGVEEGLGAVDLPTMREKHTDYPIVPGSTVKGVVREEAERRHGRDSEEVLGAFGPPQSRAGDFRGGLAFTDASLLALPVRSLCGTFAWVTCRQVLRRLRRDLEVAAFKPLRAVPEVGEGSLGLVPTVTPGESESALLVPVAGDPAKGDEERKVFLEELLLSARAEESVGELADLLAAWCWPDEPEARRFFRQRFLLVDDDVFGFLTRVGLEVRARVSIDQERGTAAESGPWTEEHMPAETLLYGLGFGRPTRVTKDPSAQDEHAVGRDAGMHWEPERSLRVLRGIGAEGALLRFGGHATIGLGRARFRVVARDEASEGHPA